MDKWTYAERERPYVVITSPKGTIIETDVTNPLEVISAVRFILNVPPGASLIQEVVHISNVTSELTEAIESLKARLIS